MLNYLKSIVLVSFLYVVHVFNYINLKENDVYLYFGHYFDYHYDFFNIIIYYFLTVPFISFVVSKNSNNIFSMLVSLILLMGVIPGSILFALSDFNSQGQFTFIVLYVFFIFILSLTNRKKITKNNNFSESEKIVIRVNFLKFLGYFGLLFFLYFSIKYFNYMSFKGFNDVYIQRRLFNGILSGWEAYFLMFTKNISAFSFLMIALYQRRFVYLLITIFIYLIDYSLAANKASIVLALFSISYYFYIYKIMTKNTLLLLIFIITILFTIVIQSLSATLTFSNIWTRIVISLYDRVFYVTATLFSRYYEFANQNYFFYGGDGLLGRIFSWISVPESYNFVIGSTYFQEGVRANADLIADGYINFGIMGGIYELFFLWIIFNKKDNTIYSKYFYLLFPLTLVYSLSLFSMGLQTTLLTGGMLFYVLILKFGFKSELK